MATAEEVISPSAQAFRGTVRVNYHKDNLVVAKASGSGFFFAYPAKGGEIICLVTAKHVAWEADKISFLIGQKGFGDQPDVSTPLEIRIDQNKILYHPDEDICIAPIGSYINKLLDEGKVPWPFVWRPEGTPSSAFLSQLRWIEDAFMVGCPSGIYDEKNLVPVARRVTTATPLHIDYMGARKFLVDGHIYKGSSGSPVLLINEGQMLLPGGKAQLGGVRTALLGIVTHTLLASDHTELGLGECLKSSVLFDFTPKLPGCTWESNL